MYKDHFSSRAAGYAAHRPGYPPELVRWLAAQAPRRELAWDAGCGSGQLSAGLAEEFDRVIATDASAEQIARATAHPKIDYRCARAEASGLPDGVVDLAVAAQAAHWFDLAAWYAEVRRVARPEGLVALVSYGMLHVDDALGAIVGRFYADVLGPYWPFERRHVEEGYRSLPFPFAEIEVPHFEMRAEWALAGLLGYIETWSAVGALVAAEGSERVETFREEVAAAWGDERRVREIRWPLALRAGRV